MVNSDKLQTIVEKFDSLPSLPGVAIKLIEAIQKTEPDIREIIKLISSDATFSAKIIKIINSALYGLPVKIHSVDQAIKMLGLNAVENLFLSLILKSSFIKKGSGGLNLAEFWKDALVGAIAAKLIAEHAKIGKPEDFFFLGLLKNIGSLTLAYLFPEQYSMVISEVQNKNIPSQDAESQVFGFNHTDVGAMLVKSWGLPEIFHVPIQYHHSVESLSDSLDMDIQHRTKILHLASLYTDLLHSEKMTNTLCYIKHFLISYGLDDSLDSVEIGKEIIHQTKEIFPIFELQFIDENELEAMLDIAKDELVNLSMQMVSAMISKDSELNLLRKEAGKDAMTQIHNYKAFSEVLNNEISRSSRYNTPLSLILADIDLFKSINDEFGHIAGDHVLKMVAQNLKKGLRDSDFIARYGGEEFAIILPETKIEKAFQVAERLREKISKLEINYDGQPIRVTISFGVASFQQMSKASFELFVKLADSALYMSKKQGRNRCSMATISPN